LTKVTHWVTFVNANSCGNPDSGRGKRGGARVIYYFLDETIPLYCLLAYPKNTKSDVTPDEKRAVSALVDALKAARKARQ
jgi:hypothetical protein